MGPVFVWRGELGGSCDCKFGDLGHGYAFRFSWGFWWFLGLFFWCNREKKVVDFCAELAANEKN